MDKQLAQSSRGLFEAANGDVSERVFGPTQEERSKMSSSVK